MPDNDDILDELEEGLNKIDEEFNKMENQANKTRRKAKTSLKDWYNKGNEWVLSNLVAVMFFIVAMTALVLYLNPALPKFELQKVKEVISAPVKAITEKQEPNETVFMKGQYLCVDTSKAEFTKEDGKNKVKETTSERTGRNIFGVWRGVEVLEQSSAINSIYYVLYEDIDNIDINKKEYANFVKAEQAKILKETK